MDLDGADVAWSVYELFAKEVEAWDADEHGVPRGLATWTVNDPYCLRMRVRPIFEAWLTPEGFRAARVRQVVSGERGFIQRQGYDGEMPHTYGVLVYQLELVVNAYMPLFGLGRARVEMGPSPASEPSWFPHLEMTGPLYGRAGHPPYQAWMQPVVLWSLDDPEVFGEMGTWLRRGLDMLVGREGGFHAGNPRVRGGGAYAEA